eukprot:948528-Prymnesium_polylepis.1
MPTRCEGVGPGPSPAHDARLPLRERRQIRGQLISHLLVILPPPLTQLVPVLPHQEQPTEEKLLRVCRTIQVLRRVLHGVSRSIYGVQAGEQAHRGQHGGKPNAEGCGACEREKCGDARIVVLEAVVNEATSDAPRRDESKQGAKPSLP